MINIRLGTPRGFCAGVDRAIEIVEEALKIYGSPIYVRHEIVHNNFVVNMLKDKGAVFVNEVDEIPFGAITIFSAHGVSDKVEKDAKIRSLKVIDATCPLVTKVHLEAKKNEQQGKQIILIGHKGHPEIEGTSGKVQSDIILVSSVEEVENISVNDENNICYITQTTLSVDDTAMIIQKLKEKFPLITGPNLNNICYATQNRQNAIKELSKKSDLILVIGSKNSSNANRLRDLGNECFVPTYLINDENDIDLNWFKGVLNLGITSGASTPEILVNRILKFINEKFSTNIINTESKKENIRFKLPKHNYKI